MIELSFLGSAYVAGKVLLTILPDGTFPLRNSFPFLPVRKPVSLTVYPPCQFDLVLTKGTSPQGGSHPCWPACHVAWAQPSCPCGHSQLLTGSSAASQRAGDQDANKWDLNCVQKYENQHFSAPTALLGFD